MISLWCASRTARREKPIRTDTSATTVVSVRTRTRRLIWAPASPPWIWLPTTPIHRSKPACSPFSCFTVDWFAVTKSRKQSIAICPHSSRRHCEVILFDDVLQSCIVLLLQSRRIWRYTRIGKSPFHLVSGETSTYLRCSILLFISLVMHLVHSLSLTHSLIFSLFAISMSTCTRLHFQCEVNKRHGVVSTQ